jgi:hypothetical protein
MNVGGASIDAENATTRNPRGIARFLMDERSTKNCCKALVGAMLHIKTSPWCPNRNEHGMSSSILEG